jgi:Tfp pilus assembly protein PilN
MAGWRRSRRRKRVRMWQILLVATLVALPLVSVALLVLMAD